ncbi:MAG: hypothetical protein KatS3mg027_2370 [Bacteroidia bacterium]|nr:MAG: hypothetical protein KatS3mg027_2370 [Bacteroidia bacterium]
MILILSNLRDVSTELVEDVLLANKIDFYRVNEEDEIWLEKFEINKTSFKIWLRCIDTFNQQKLIKLETVSAFWYRRGIFGIRLKHDLIKNKYIRRYLNNVKITLLDFILSLLVDVKHVNKFEDIYVNKLYVLHIAGKCGLDIPHTFLTEKLNEINKIDKDKFITKEFVYPYFTLNKIDIYPLTKLISDYNFNIINDISLSLIQKKIDKNFDIRIFFINRKFYSAAIFSNDSKKTKIDFRDYEHEDAPRIIRYSLPKEILIKLKKLVSYLNINCGSMDMIKGRDGKFYFLEINPIGQWQFISENCYFKLENEIAKALVNKKIEHNEKKTKYLL